MATELQFISSTEPTKHRWGIIMAGGEGKRLQQFLRNEYHIERPKQYYALLGERSMLRQTIDRASMLIPKSQLLTVINERHRPFAEVELADREPESVIAQPVNRETAPGILLPLLHIIKRDPDAVVALFPTDHFIVEENYFMEHVRAAFVFAERLPEFLVTLGVTPNRVQPGYGWIQQEDLISTDAEMSMYSVKSFWEKPNAEITQELYTQGCLWNTLTLVGSAARFLDHFEKLQRDLYRTFLPLRNAIGTQREAAVTAQVFHAIPTVNFSHGILERIAQHLGVVPVHHVYWNDWGDEARVREDLLFAEQYLGASFNKAPLTLAYPAPPRAPLLRFHKPIGSTPEPAHSPAVHEHV
ncbi:MAG: hypothetical protein L0Y80_12985 [Ignavibacteriae bacterium]|nr:hypothetical protein [Ignavibacteriota bacterium]